MPARARGTYRARLQLSTRFLLPVEELVVAASVAVAVAAKSRASHASPLVEYRRSRSVQVGLAQRVSVATGQTLLLLGLLPTVGVVAVGLRPGPGLWHPAEMAVQVAAVVVALVPRMSPAVHP